MCVYMVFLGALKYIREMRDNLMLVYVIRGCGGIGFGFILFSVRDFGLVISFLVL